MRSIQDEIIDANHNHAQRTPHAGRQFIDEQLPQQHQKSIERICCVEALFPEMFPECIPELVRAACHFQRNLRRGNPKPATAETRTRRREEQSSLQISSSRSNSKT